MKTTRTAQYLSLIVSEHSVLRIWTEADVLSDWTELTLRWKPKSRASVPW